MEEWSLPVPYIWLPKLGITMVAAGFALTSARPLAGIVLTKIKAYQISSLLLYGCFLVLRRLCHLEWQTRFFYTHTTSNVNSIPYIARTHAHHALTLHDRNATKSWRDFVRSRQYHLKYVIWSKNITAPIHYQDQCWLIISEVLVRHLPWCNFAVNTQDVIPWHECENYNGNFTACETAIEIFDQ